MNAEMLDELTRVDSREVDLFLEEMEEVMADEAARIEEERKRMDVLLEAFRL